MVCILLIKLINWRKTNKCGECLFTTTLGNPSFLFQEKQSKTFNEPQINDVHIADLPNKLEKTINARSAYLQLLWAIPHFYFIKKNKAKPLISVDPFDTYFTRIIKENDSFMEGWLPLFLPLLQSPALFQHHIANDRSDP